ncbi:MAG: metallophosphoesterase [Solirubrobacteraceae bacterium]
MTRTLLISDLHIGRAESMVSSAERRVTSVVLQEAPLERLLSVLDGYDRLVLLGDTLELRASPAHVSRALDAAAPVLRAIGARLGREREVVIVAGNHDRALVEGWTRGRRDELTPATAVPLDATPLLACIASLLAPAHVRTSYPGVWLSERIWATHGHYLDPHLLPVGAYGVARRAVRRRQFEPASIGDYERATGPRAGGTGHALRRPFLALAQPLLAPLTATLLDRQMRSQALPALAHVLRRLHLDADWVLFGHVHRLGPLRGEDPAAWAAPGGSPRLVNSGSWMYEPLLVGRAAPPHPYWPGGAITLQDGGEPCAICLLEELSASQLREV